MSRHSRFIKSDRLGKLCFGILLIGVRYAVWFAFVRFFFNHFGVENVSLEFRWIGVCDVVLLTSHNYLVSFFLGKLVMKAGRDV